MSSYFLPIGSRVTLPDGTWFAVTATEERSDPGDGASGEADQWHRWARERSRRAFLRGSFRLDAVDAADRLGWLGRMERRAISTAEIDGVTYVPAWQFDRYGEVLPGVEPLVRYFPGDAVALNEWVTQACPGLGLVIPLALLLQGQVDRVVGHVQGLGSW